MDVTPKITVNPATATMMTSRTRRPEARGWAFLMRRGYRTLVRVSSARRPLGLFVLDCEHGGRFVRHTTLRAARPK